MFRYRIDDRLDLRVYEERHAQEAFDLVVANREHLRRWLPWVDATQRVEDTLAFIRRGLEQFARGDGFHCGVWLDGRIVGCIGMHHIRMPAAKTELGYWLAEPLQGQGIITRATRAMTDFCFGELKLNRVAIECAVENHRSRAVPRRLGFKEEGVLRDAGKLHGGYVDHVVYAMLARDWTK